MKSAAFFTILKISMALFQITGNKCLETDCEVVPLEVTESWQSSNYEGTFIQQLIASLLGYNAFSASNGVDGRVVSGAVSGTCSQTKMQDNPWFQVQLRNSFYVTSFEITTSSVAGDTKIEQVLAEVGEVSVDYFSDMWEKQWMANKQRCAFIDMALDPGSTHVVNCSQPVNGNFVRLTKLMTATVLSVCEIELRGYQQCTSSEQTILTSTVPSYRYSLSSSTLDTVSSTRIFNPVESFPSMSTSLDRTTMFTSFVDLLMVTKTLKTCLSTAMTDLSIRPSTAVNVSIELMTSTQFNDTETLAPDLLTWMSLRYITSTLADKPTDVSTFGSSFTAEPIQMSSSTQIWCPCTCEQANLIANVTTTNKTPEEVEEEVAELVINMTVEAKTTAKSERKLVSAEDNRKSSKVIGTLGIIFIVMAFGLIVAADIPVFASVIKEMYQNIIGQ